MSEPTQTPPVTGGVPDRPGVAEVAGDGDWQRLDPRMLLVHPVREVGRFLPVLLGLFVAGTASGEDYWRYAGVVLPVLVGLLRYLTTRFRIAHGRVELRRGLLNRHTLSVPVERVRTVDLTSSPVHRLLGLTTVRVGTGTASTDEDDAVDLDGLPLARARRLREELLHEPEPVDGDVRRPAAPGGVPVLRLDPAWARYAPLTSTGVVLALGVLGVGSQVLDRLGGPGGPSLRELATGAAAASAWLAAPLLVLGLLVAVSALAVGGYLVANWGFTLTRTARAWHLRRGLVTTRETTLDEERVAGVTLVEPWGLRAAGAARLQARVTGLGGAQQGSATLVPPAPYAVAAGVAREVLGTDRPLTAPLVPHGAAAVRRRWVRALLPAVLAATAVGALVAAGAPGWLLVLAAALPAAAAGVAHDRGRALGHSLAEGHLVARSGSLVRRREVLATEHVIGWVLRETWSQRRAGLVSLVATTAGGDQAVLVQDVPREEAVAVADAAVPELLTGLLTGPVAGQVTGP